MSNDAELADAACSCQALRHANSIAGWVGDGRQVTADGMPARDDLTELAGSLGITPPTDTREVADVPELYRAWTVALNLELLAFDGDQHVTAGPGVIHWASLEPDEVLEHWTEALVATVADTLGVEEDSDAAELCVLALEVVAAADEPPTRERLCAAVESRLRQEYDDTENDDTENTAENDTGERPDTVDDSRPLREATARTLVTELAAFGAVDDELLVTPLGRYGLDAIESFAAGADPEVLETLNELLDEAGIDPTDTAAVQSWLENSAPLDELLTPDDADRDTDEDDESTNPSGALNLKTAFDLPENLPPVSLPDDSELAELARDSELLGSARRLALWLGDGVSTTDADEPTRTHALEAARALGTDQYTVAEADNASTAPTDEGMEGLAELADLWELAEVAGFIELETGRAVPGPNLLHWPDGDDSTVLTLWSQILEDVLMHSAFGTVAATDESGTDFTGVGVLLAVLLFLSRDAGVALDELEDVVSQTHDLDPDDESDRAFEAWVANNGSPVQAFLARMARIGAAEQDDTTAWLTPLGRYALHAWLVDSGVTVPALPPAERMSAAELVSAAESGDQQELTNLSTAWLAVHEPDVAADQLLAVAAESDPTRRVVATSIVQEIDPAPRACWEAALDTPSLRPYAKVALSQLADDGDGSRIEPSQQELAWLLTDTIAATVDPDRDDEVAEDLNQLVVPSVEQTELFDNMRRCGHPNVHEVLSIIGRHHPDTKTAKAARKAAFQGE